MGLAGIQFSHPLIPFIKRFNQFTDFSCKLLANQLILSIIMSIGVINIQASSIISCVSSPPVERSKRVRENIFKLM